MSEIHRVKSTVREYRKHYLIRCQIRADRGFWEDSRSVRKRYGKVQQKLGDLKSALPAQISTMLNDEDHIRSMMAMPPARDVEKLQDWEKQLAKELDKAVAQVDRAVMRLGRSK